VGRGRHRDSELVQLTDDPSADPTATYEAFTAERIKHLELIQNVIGRLGNDAFLVKGWAVTVEGVFLGLAVQQQAAGLAVVAVIPSLAFWGLDTYFLRSERLFRALYDEVRSHSAAVAPFFMAATSLTFIERVSATERMNTIGSRWHTAWRPTLWVFYLALIAAALVVALVICHRHR